jgi:hypothetical protein
MLAYPACRRNRFKLKIGSHDADITWVRLLQNRRDKRSENLSSCPTAPSLLVTDLRYQIERKDVVEKLAGVGVQRDLGGFTVSALDFALKLTQDNLQSGIRRQWEGSGPDQALLANWAHTSTSPTSDPVDEQQSIGPTGALSSFAGNGLLSAGFGGFCFSQICIYDARSVVHSAEQAAGYGWMGNVFDQIKITAFVD